jgi:hypothetical protein
MKLYILTLAIFLCPLFVQGQRVYAYNWEGGIMIGTAHYVGDLNPSVTPRLKDVRLSAGVMGRIPLSRKAALRSGFMYGSLVGDEANFPQRRIRGYTFQTDIFEMNVLMEFEPFARDKFFSDSKGNLNLEKLISPYIFAGGGFSYARLSPDFSRVQDVVSEPLVSEDRRATTTRMIPLIPAGAGVKLDFNINLGIALEASGRFAFTDYIDGISKAANPNKDDSYFMVNACVFKRF